MKLSYNWLREWVDVPATAHELTTRITLAGLESDAEPMLAEAIDGVVVGRILKAERHPQADRLQVCQVDVGDGQPRQIVCGAPNARVGLCAPCALPGAKLPGGMEIKQAQLRGVDSGGMLCSAKELTLSDKSDGLLELDDSAKPGAPITEYLNLGDDILNLELTPNRGDCLSVQGLAREVGALYSLSLRQPEIPTVAASIADQIKIEIDDLTDCANYAGRLINGLNSAARTPDWMREKLRRSGIRSIHPVVDITNYVLLELGQPMHAFDAAKLSGGIRVRRANKAETLKLLNEQVIELNHGELLIADDRGALALAGVMGGAESGVGGGTTAVLFESACFAPAAVAGTGRRHKLNSDALYRFERGVDPELQRRALERATQLTLQICGGQAGPVVHVGRVVSETVTINLRAARLKHLLGHQIPAEEVESLLARLGIRLAPTMVGWNAGIPSHRHDLRIEHDLIEEVARLYGYDNIPAQPYRAALTPAPVPENRKSVDRAKDTLIARGWQEAVTLSFVDAAVQSVLAPQVPGIALDNPIAEPLAVMRSTLWSGLLPAWLYNHQRQMSRVRLFEFAVCFAQVDGVIIETPRLAGLAAGTVTPEQWGLPQRAVDFYDVKADLEALLGAQVGEYRFEAGEHPALHPGRTARVLRNGKDAGWLGVLHPGAVRVLGLPSAPVLFELNWDIMEQIGLPHHAMLSEFPSSRRDLALVLPEATPADALVRASRAAGGAVLKQAWVFDVYRGEALGEGFKSVALGLIFQENSRTLTLEEVDAAVQAVAQQLHREFGATVRT